MRTIISLAAACLAAAGAWAQDANKPDPVRELKLLGVDLGRTMVKVPSESVLKTEKAFAERVADKDWRAKPENKVDFLAEEVVFFEWHGSTFDTITAEQKGGKVVFTYTVTNSDTFGSNFRAFVVPAGSKIELVTVKE